MVRLPVPLVPHSANLGPVTATSVLSALVPVSAPPTGLDECLFFISLVLDFLAVQFSVSSGFARRRSVSTYAAILVLSYFFSFLIFIQLQLSAFSPHPSTPPQPVPPPSPISTLPLDFVLVSFIVAPIDPSPHYLLPTPPWLLLQCS